MKRVEYIESSGTQYIDTGIINNANIRIVVEMSAQGTNVLNGSEIGGSNGRYKFGTGGAGALYVGFGSNNYDVSVTPTLSDYYTFDIAVGSQQIIDSSQNALLSQTNTSLTKFNTYAITLFRVRSSNGSFATTSGNMRIKSCKIYDNGVLVRDYLPMLDDLDVPMLYDQLNNVKYYNAGSGTFTYGSVVTCKGYIGISNLAQKISKIYIGVNNIARQVKKAYIGIGGIARKIYEYVAGGFTTITYLQDAPNGLTQSRSTYNQVANAGDYVVAMGGYLSSNYSDMAEAYDSSLVKTTATNMVATRIYACADSFGSYAVIAGGYGKYNGSNGYQQTYDTYDSSLVHSNGTFGFTSNGLATVSNSTYCGFFGGYGGSMRNMVRYFDSTFTVSTGTNLGQARQNVMGTKIGENILICGGANTSTTYYKNVDVYDKDMVHSTGTALSVGRYRGSAGHTDSYAFVFGGFTSSVSSASKTGSDVVDVYDTNLVHSTATALAQARGVGGGFSTSTLAGMLTGGREANGTYTICDYYDNNLVHSTYNVNQDCQEAGAGAVGEYLLLFGGCPYTGSTRGYTDKVQVSKMS